MKKTFIWLLGTIFILTSCKDIVAVNIEGKTPVVILPVSGQTVNANPVHFKWEAMEGATKYRVQVASPNFANISEYLIDSLIVGTDFYFQLDSNNYELKLTALNAGYESNTLDSVFFSVGVNSSTGGTNIITLSSPSDSLYYSSQNVFESKFAWEDLSSASYYEFYLKKGSSFSSGVLYDYDGHVNPPYKFTNVALGEGQYFWGVRAYLNNEAETDLSIRSFYIDSTRPKLPSPISPATTVSPGDITFTWSDGGQDPGIIHSTVKTTLQIAEDQNFTINLESYIFSGTSGIVNLIGTGNRYWRVKNIDAAGNESVYSNFSQFSLF